jgi:beta-1,4-mannooligosaccharide/beta-1,4-mannosyl-N-acetylglucosamine phosphorylase
VGKASKSKMIVGGAALPNMPWQDRPAGSTRVIWRYNANPIITRDVVACANSIFNSAVVPFGGKFAGVFRVDDRRRYSHIHVGHSNDGLAWRIDPEPIRMSGAKPEVAASDYQYDPRVVVIDGRYYVSWCNDHHGPTIGLAWTDDFRTFHQYENTFLPANRNGVLFPRKIGGNYAMLSRPSDWGHTPFGDVFYSESPDLEYWGRHRWVMARRAGWQSLKIGPGPVPIETPKGWLLLYHGVLLSCNGYVYSFGAAMLDLDQPWKVRYRCTEYLLSPQELYECVGDTPNVVFPCAVLTDGPTGRIAIYYGAADTVTCLAFAQADELVQYVKDHSEV